MTDIAFLPAKHLANLIRRRRIGSLELLDHYIARVEKHNPVLNAIIATDIPAARRRAKAADKEVALGEKLGPLHGVPMTVKQLQKELKRLGLSYRGKKAELIARLSSAE